MNMHERARTSKYACVRVRAMTQCLRVHMPMCGLILVFFMATTLLFRPFNLAVRFVSLAFSLAYHSFCALVISRASKLCSSTRVCYVKWYQCLTQFPADHFVIDKDALAVRLLSTAYPNSALFR